MFCITYLSVRRQISLRLVSPLREMLGSKPGALREVEMQSRHQVQDQRVMQCRRGSKLCRLRFSIDRDLID
jgi:hypothetical protein